MVEVITYSLRSDHKRSDQYYKDVAAFTEVQRTKQVRCTWQPHGWGNR